MQSNQDSQSQPYYLSQQSGRDLEFLKFLTTLKQVFLPSLGEQPYGYLEPEETIYPEYKELQMVPEDEDYYFFYDLMTQISYDSLPVLITANQDIFPRKLKELLMIYAREAYSTKPVKILDNSDQISYDFQEIPIQDSPPPPPRIQDPEILKKMKNQIFQTSFQLTKKTYDLNYQLFCGLNTQENDLQFKYFVQSLKHLFIIKSIIKFRDPLEKIKITRIPHKLIQIINEDKDNRLLILQTDNFPFFTVGEQHLDLIQALMFLKQFKVKKMGPSTPMKLFPYLFIRQSNLSYDIFVQTVSILQEHSLYFAEKLTKFYEQNTEHVLQTDLQDLIIELLRKAMSKIVLISIPDLRDQLRGFIFAGKVYLNTYVLQRNNFQENKQVCVAYYFLTLVRLLASYVLERLDNSENRIENLEEKLTQISERKDFGSKFQQYITDSRKFQYASAKDYYILKGLIIQFTLLGLKHKNQPQISIYFIKQQQQQDIMIQVYNPERRDDEQSQISYYERLQKIYNRQKGWMSPFIYSDDQDFRYSDNGLMDVEEAEEAEGEDGVRSRKQFYPQEEQMSRFGRKCQLSQISGEQQQATHQTENSQSKQKQSGLAHERESHEQSSNQLK